MIKIGILGGMGPRATIKFEQLLLDRLDGGDQSIVPMLVLNDGTIPDRTLFLTEKGEDPVPKLNENMTVLVNWGANYICIPCNTSFAPDIIDRVHNGSNVINLPLEVVKYVRQQGISKVMVLATRGTVFGGVYRRYLEDSEYIHTEEEIQSLVDECIDQVKRGQFDYALNIAEKVSIMSRKMGADAVILGCTELSYVESKFDRPIDSLSVLADVTASKVKG